METKKIAIIAGVVLLVIGLLGFLFYKNYQITQNASGVPQEVLDSYASDFEAMDSNNKYLESDPDATAENMFTKIYEEKGQSWAEPVVTEWDSYAQYNALTEPSFDEVVTNDTSGEYIAVYYFQYGCSHCNAFHYQSLEPTYADMQNTDNFYVYPADYYGFDRVPETTDSEGNPSQGTPTVGIYKDGELVDSFVVPNNINAPYEPNADLQAQWITIMKPYGFYN